MAASHTPTPQEGATKITSTTTDASLSKARTTKPAKSFSENSTLSAQSNGLRDGTPKEKKAPSPSTPLYSYTHHHSPNPSSSFTLFLINSFPTYSKSPMIYNLYIYNKCCECIFYAEWNRSPPSLEKRSLDSKKLELAPTSQTTPFISDSPSSFLLNSTSTFKNPFSPSPKDFKPPIAKHSPKPNNTPLDNLIRAANTNINSPNFSDSLPNPPKDSPPDNSPFILDVWKLNLLNSSHPIIEDSKLVYGSVFSIRNFINKLNAPNSPFGGNTGNFYSYKTHNYKCHYFESPSGIKLVLNTDTNIDSMQQTLQHIYSHIYVEYIVKSPLSSISIKRPQTFESSDAFKAALNTYIQSLPSFS
ncbi:Trafficking protein particle complex subunit 1 [Smittium culicis]|uniref:Trafficking protein particle complex subunit 1 n=1 Tax=Smittium culicis TaxID=133412 RepID=A0A1R1Y5Y0_9FUNG|nr:Trafficking protein particle complex subunit 1 [Smittium culicis]